LPSPNLVRSLLLAFFSIAASFSQAQEPAPATEPSPAAEQRAKAHFQFPGLGFIIGDGRLSYGLEQIAELYYKALAVEHIWLTADYQFVLNPA